MQFGRIVIFSLMIFYLTGNSYSTDTGILFHASFNGSKKAEAANGPEIPSRLKHLSFLNTFMDGKYIDGKFGKALTGKNNFGWYWALGNFHPERGTISFFINKKDFPYGFEPFSVMTRDQYYWNRYIMLKNSKKSSMFSTRFAEEAGLLKLYPAGKNKNDFTDGKWHHIAIAWDQAYGANVYLDGKIYASNWGNSSWLTKGVDPDYFSLLNSDDVAYDELYVFDRPLNEKQIQSLAENNQAPSPEDIEPLIFDDRRRANRIKELSWEKPEEIPLHAESGAETSVTQVIPDYAKAVKRDAFAVLDGKLGTVWPFTYGYGYSNGLHVKISKPYDYIQIEGQFSGNIYNSNKLLERESGKPLLNIKKSSYMYRKKFPHGNTPSELSFFRSKTNLSETKETDQEKLQDDLDEAPTIGRIAELSFFKTGHADFSEDKTQKFTLGSLSVKEGATLLKNEFTGRYFDWDSNVVTAYEGPQEKEKVAQLKGLQYYHIIIPAPEQKTVLDGIKLSLNLKGKTDNNIIRVELRDPTIFSRRITAVDFSFSSIMSDVTKLNLSINTPDAMLFPGTFIWITICFKEDVNLLNGPTNGSSVEIFHTDNEKNVKEYVDREISFVKSRFMDASEPRPWSGLNEPEKELSPYSPIMKELFLPLVRAREAMPDDARVNAIWNWTHKMAVNETPIQPESVEGCENAPQWALLQRELLKGCRNIYLWWLANRQVPNGEFGNDLSDDSDLVQDFVKPALFSDPDGKFRESLCKVADACYSQRLKNGINKITTDYLHAYEEGVNVQAAAALISYGNPKYIERLMETTKTVRDFLTAKDKQNRRRFKASTYGASEVRDKGATGIDIPSNALMLHPALFLCYYGKNQAAFELVKEWCEGWRAYAAEAKTAGRNDIPVATRFDGTVVRYDRKLDGFGVHDTFAAFYDMTRNPGDKDTAIFQTNREVPEIKNQPLLDMIDIQKYKNILAAQTLQADLKYPATDKFGWTATRRYLLYDLTGNENAVIQSLEACIRNIRMLYEAYTWAEPWNDRIWVPDSPAVMMAFGAIPHERNQTWPRHYVSYEGFSDFAAWVKEKSDTHIKILLYNFSKNNETGKIRLWRNVSGIYSVNTTMLENGKKENLEEFKTSVQRASELSITLPSGKLCSVEINLDKKNAEDITGRCDLAISPDDISRTDDGIKVKVHNLGNNEAKNIKVRILDLKNNISEEKTIEKIDAPYDLRPRTAEILFSKKIQIPFKVTIDPDEQIAEIYKFNNIAEIKEP